MAEYRVCSRCVMDTSDPDITFDENGYCNHCRRAMDQLSDRVVSGEEGQRRFNAEVEKVKRLGKGKEYDCILGISGGADSSYLAVKVVNAGLRPLAVHFDSGWNSEQSVRNIENLVKGLGIDLFTIVCDWEDMKDLQRSFFRASLVNCDVPQDHAFVAVLWQLAIKHKIKTIFSGHNVSTESVLPKHFRGYTSSDWRHIKAVQDQFGSKTLRGYPHVSFWKQVYYRHWVRFRVINALNYLDYHKADAMRALEDEYGWVSYKGKHGESRFTKFFQGYYLPEKFGIDKRRAHLSALVLTGQMTRDAALEELKEPFYTDANELQEDKLFVLKKLDITESEWEEIMKAPKCTEDDYPSDKQLYQTEQKLIESFASISKKILPTEFRDKLRNRYYQSFKG